MGLKVPESPACLRFKALAANGNWFRCRDSSCHGRLAGQGLLVRVEGLLLLLCTGCEVAGSTLSSSSKLVRKAGGCAKEDEGHHLEYLCHIPSQVSTGQIVKCQIVFQKSKEVSYSFHAEGLLVSALPWSLVASLCSKQLTSSSPMQGVQTRPIPRMKGAVRVQVQEVQQ